MDALEDHDVHWWKNEAHKALDALWRGKRKCMTRRSAYRVATRLMERERGEVHISQLDRAGCALLIERLRWYKRHRARRQQLHQDGRGRTLTAKQQQWMAEGFW